MVIYYNNDQLLTLFQDESFLLGYETYQSHNKRLQEFRTFIDSIEINKKYFRLTMNKTGYRKKYHKQNVGEDTRALKEIHSYLNKMTDQSYPKLIQEITTRVQGRDYLYRMIMELFIDKCVIYPQYISLYLKGLHAIYGTKSDFNNMVMSCVDDSYQSILNTEIEEESEYLIFCAKNKRLDKLIGHSMLVTECEKRKIVTDRIHPSLAKLLDIIKDGTSDEESYKCVQCVYEIMKSLYNENLLPQGYIDRLQALIQEETTPKIKYKMMDIIERR